MKCYLNGKTISILPNYIAEGVAGSRLQDSLVVSIVAKQDVEIKKGDIITLVYSNNLLFYIDTEEGKEQGKEIGKS